MSNCVMCSFVINGKTHLTFSDESIITCEVCGIVTLRGASNYRWNLFGPILRCEDKNLMA